MTSRPGYLKHIKRDAVFENEIILCKCGCETQIERYWKDTRGYWWERFYIRGHIRRGMKNGDKQKDAMRTLATSPDWHEKVVKGIEKRNSNPNWASSVSSETAKKRWQTTRKHELVEKIKATCSYCNKDAWINPNRKKFDLYFCNRECSDLYHSGENHPFYSGKPKKYPRAWTKYLKLKIIERDGGMCVICKCIPVHQNLCVHHIDEDKYNCSEDNLISLCRGCHMKVHRKKVDIPESCLFSLVL